MDILSIGFTHENASEFFETLKANGLERLLEVRLSNTSQLAGFTKQAGLQYFLKESCGAAYEHEPLLAPSEELFRAYCKEGGRWEAIARGYLKLLKARKKSNPCSPSQASRRRRFSYAAKPQPNTATAASRLSSEALA
jgi:hypothetical protein